LEHQDERIRQAIEEWRGAPENEGNAAFFQLGKKLVIAGLSEWEVETRLQDEVAYAGSPDDRKRDVPRVISWLREKGFFRDGLAEVA
jgi:hypothetical protein